MSTIPATGAAPDRGRAGPGAAQRSHPRPVLPAGMGSVLGEGRLDPEVIQAARRFRSPVPHHQQDARRAAQLIGRIIEQGPMPLLMVNRPVHDAVELLERQAGRLPTIFDATGPPRSMHAMDAAGAWDGFRERRRTREQALGVHGSGDRAGHTIYGSLQLSHEVGGSDGRVRPNPGAVRYGRVSFELDPAVLRRTTISAVDSGAGPRIARIAPPWELREVIAERVMRSHGWIRDPNLSKPSPWGKAAQGERSRELRSLLREPSPAAAEAYLRAHLRDDTWIGRWYVESQVRGVDVSDIRGVRIDLRPGSGGVREATHGAALVAAEPRLAAAAEALGLRLLRIR